MSKSKTEALKLTVAQEVLAVEAVTKYAMAFTKSRAGLGKMSGFILDLAKAATADAGGDMQKAVILYSAMCKHAETVHKETNEDKPISVLLPFWQPCKSSILRAMRAELDPRDSETVYELTKELADKPAARAPRQTKGEKEQSLSICKSLGTALETLYGTLGALNTENQEAAAIKVLELVTYCRDLFAGQQAPDTYWRSVGADSEEIAS